MELWSLMHFLMPTIFRSHSHFQQWFHQPISGIVEGVSGAPENKSSKSQSQPDMAAANLPDFDLVSKAHSKLLVDKLHAILR